MAKFIAPIWLVYLLCGFSESLISPTDLRVEYLRNPHAVDSPNPRLSWKVKAVNESKHPQNLTQKAYQIMVASSPKLLVAKKPDLWDTKEVFSDNTFDIRYEGKSLESGQTVFWTVRAWDNINETPDYTKVSIFNFS